MLKVIKNLENDRKHKFNTGYNANFFEKITNVNKNMGFFFFFRSELFLFDRRVNNLGLVFKGAFCYFCPYSVTYAHLKRKFLFILLKLESSSYQGIRHFLCLPSRGAKTHSNRKSQRLNNKGFLMYYKDFYYKKIKAKCPHFYETLFIYAEFLNAFWFRFFNKEWCFAKNRRIDYILSNKYVGWRYDLKSILANRVYVFLEKKEIVKKNKKRKNKKKVKIKNNLFNIGFPKFFTISLQKIIIGDFFSIKIKEKNKKK